jgi:hypothetical membrane protein
VRASAERPTERPTGRQPVPWWGLASSAAAPVLLVGGWTVAAARQRGGFDPVVETISDLAAYGADDRWVMTTALVGVGLCHAVTATALRDAASVGRALLAAGGVGTLLVAATPLPADGSGSRPHTLAAGLAFAALSVWPAAAWRRAGRGPGRGPLRPLPSLAAAAVLCALTGWFVVELAADSARVGLSERCAAGAQALWPAVVAFGARRWRG